MERIISKHESNISMLENDLSKQAKVKNVLSDIHPYFARIINCVSFFKFIKHFTFVLR